MARIIAWVNQKGGCGKSTAAVHFANWLLKQGNIVVAVDADTHQSSSHWLKFVAPEMTVKVLQSPDDLIEQIPELAAQYRYVIIDGPAASSETTRAILLRSDVAIIPCQPTGLDLRSAFDTLRLVKQAQSIRGGLPKVAIFLSRAMKGNRLEPDAAALLQKFPDVCAMNTIIHQTQAIADASGRLVTVWEFSSWEAGGSAREYENLFHEIITWDSGK